MQVGASSQRIIALHERSPLGHVYPFVDSNLCEIDMLVYLARHAEWNIRLSLEIYRKRLSVDKEITSDYSCTDSLRQDIQ